VRIEYVHEGEYLGVVLGGLSILWCPSRASAWGGHLWTGSDCCWFCLWLGRLEIMLVQG
jgi:hypothetical protein